MTRSEQIIGRGTRINEDYGKYYFTILDFKRATELFADPAFDGDPVQIYEPNGDASPVPPDDPGTDGEGDADRPTSTTLLPGTEGVGLNGFDGDDNGRSYRYVVGNVPVRVVAERVQYFDANGKLITESLKEYTRKTIAKEFASLNDFLTQWNAADKKHAIITALSDQGIFFEALAEEVARQSGKGFDPFDLLCHVAWDQPPLTRKERAEQVKKRDYFAKYGEQARLVIDALLDKYADEGLGAIEETKILSIYPFTHLGTPVELIQAFGGLTQYQQAVSELEQALYYA